MDWKLWERQWFEKWSAELHFHISLAADVHNFVARVATNDQIVDAQPTRTLSLERFLIRRLGEEYRAVDLLAVSGHGFQAMSAFLKKPVISRFMRQMTFLPQKAILTRLLEWVLRVTVMG
jgi:hypothetical protein